MKKTNSKIDMEVAGKNTSDLVFDQKLWNMQQRANELQNRYPTKHYTTYGIKTFNAKDVTPGWDGFNAYHGDIYMLVGGTVTRYNVEIHGDLTRCPHYKFRLENGDVEEC